MDNDLMVDACNEYEKLLRKAEEKDYNRWWVWYRLKEKYGEKIADEIFEIEEK